LWIISGANPLQNITHADIEKFKLEPLKTPTWSNKERLIASVNREFEVLRAVLRFATRSGWLIKGPFDMGDKLISKANGLGRNSVKTSGKDGLPSDALLALWCNVTASV